MEIIQWILSTSFQILQIELRIFDYRITLFNVVAYTLIVYVLLRLVFSIIDKDR